MPEVRKKRGKFIFHGYFSVLLNLTIVAAAVLWLAYGRLPNQYYLPISFSIIALTGVAAFFLLNNKMKL
jgi:hypothetical protein